jgi:hypothetical protein
MPNAESFIFESVESSAALARFNMLIERRNSLLFELRSIESRLKEVGKIIVDNDRSARGLEESEYLQICREQFDHGQAVKVVKNYGL